MTGLSRESSAGIILPEQEEGHYPGGIGWYRKTFTVDKADEGKRLYIDFDGVYMNSEVFINGHSLGVRPYGYVSFSYDLTPHIKWGGKNVVAVSCGQRGTT